METGRESIRNRDIAVIRRVYGLMQDIVALEERCAWERGRLMNITTHLNSNGGGFGGGMPKGMDDAFSAISDIEQRHEALCLRYRQELQAAENIINSIASAELRTFVVLTYLEGVKSREVRNRLNLTRYAYEAAREAVEKAECMADVVWKTEV